MKKCLICLLLACLFIKTPTFFEATETIEAKTLPQKRKIDLNLDDSLWLEMLTQVGPRRAQMIIGARPIKSEADLLKIKGISQKMLDKWRPHIKELKASQSPSN